MAQIAGRNGIAASPGKSVTRLGFPASIFRSVVQKETGAIDCFSFGNAVGAQG